ncbi:MAG TPA: glycerol-3-phosphate dehydrogenase C-terminal domain-containing protein, partial [Armatimonadota bacterium]|nr:glycerol-3-phosphate dehydrogenase C-terminal domain-containing protein [Armatimonadota bacterium]
VLKYVERSPQLGKALGPGIAALEAQVVHAAEREGARTADDILRRRLMLLPPTEEALAAVRRVCEEQGLGVE